MNRSWTAMDQLKLTALSWKGDKTKPGFSTPPEKNAWAFAEKNYWAKKYRDLCRV